MLEGRLQKIRDNWALSTPPADFTSIAVVAGDAYEGQPDNQRSTAIIQYLFGLPAGPSDVAVLLEHDNSHGALQLSYTIGEKSNAVIDGAITSAVPPLSLDAFLAKLKSISPATLRTCSKELPLVQGTFAASIVSTLSSVDDAAPFIGSLLFVKDDESIGNLTKASSLATAVFRRVFRPELERIVTKNEIVPLAQFAQMIASKIAAPKTIDGLENMDAEGFAPGLPVFVSHAGEFNDKATATVTSVAPVAPNVVTVRYGVKYRGYTAFLARTEFFESSMPPLATKAHDFAVDLEAKVMEELVAGAHVAAVANKCLAFAREKNAELAAKLVMPLGWITGLLVSENKGQIGDKGTVTVAANMPFVIRIVLADLDDGKGGKFAVELADTVLTLATGAAEFRTKVTRATSDHVFAMDDLEEEEVEDETPVETRKDLRSITRAGKGEAEPLSAEMFRMEQLTALLAAKKNEWDQNGGKRVTSEVLDEFRTFEIGRLGLGETSCYHGEQDKPSDIPPSMLRVHRPKNAAWMPVGGRAVPFHISCINKIDIKKEGANVSMTVSFLSTQESNLAYRQHRTKVFIRELTYTTTREEKQFDEFARQVREVQALIKNADAQRKAKQGLAATGTLKLISNPARLRQVKMRPPPVAGGKNRDVGNLDLHENGLRFNYSGESLDFPFENIKHLIFQHAVSGESVVIFHITLKQPMMIGKNKTEEVQVIAEVLEAADDLDKGVRRTAAQEEEQEEKERRRLVQTNTEFVAFSRATEAKFGRNVEIGMSSFVFQGVAQVERKRTEMTKIRGSKNVLWAITEFPFFTMSVKEIEIAHFERVAPGNTTFDIAFVPITYKSVITVTTVGTSKLGTVKDWCLAARLPYAEHGINISWPQMLKVIREDQSWEPWGPEGWQTCMEDDEEDEEDDTSDSSYHESEDEEADDDDDDDDDDSDASLDWDESESSPSTESSGSEDSDEYWEKMEKKAKDDDAKHRQSDDDDDSDKPRRKQPRTEGRPAGGAGGKAAPARPMAGGNAARPAGSSMKSAPPMFGKGAPARPANSVPPRPAGGLPRR